MDLNGLLFLVFVMFDFGWLPLDLAGRSALGRTGARKLHLSAGKRRLCNMIWSSLEGAMGLLGAIENLLPLHLCRQTREGSIGQCYRLEMERSVNLCAKQVMST